MMQISLSMQVVCLSRVAMQSRDRLEDTNQAFFAEIEANRLCFNTMICCALFSHPQLLMGWDPHCRGRI